MTILGAFIRAVVVTVSMWVGQTVIGPSNKTGLWAMASLGIASAIVGVVITRYVAHTRRRLSAAGLQFLATTLVLEVFYLLLPKVHPLTSGSDAGLALAIGVISGLSEWIVPDLSPIRRPRT